MKQKAWVRYKRTLHPSDYSNYALYRNECTAAVRRAKCDFESNLVKGIKANPKRFCKYVASQSKVKHALSELLKPDGSQTVDDSDTANTLNNFLVVFLHMRNPETYLHLKFQALEVLLLLSQ